MGEVLQLGFSGMALGCKYGLVALGFVVIYRATGVLNFAQGALVLLGGYVAYQLIDASLPFAAAVLLAMVACGLLGVAVERVFLRHMTGKPVFAVIMLTLGLLIIIEQLVPTIWGYEPFDLGDPWGVETIEVAGTSLAVRDMWVLVLAPAALLAFFLLDRFSRYGLAMRATALDPESAAASGISISKVVALSWLIAGLVAGLGGVMLATGAAGVDPSLGSLALAAFPAIILGGLDSPGGAVVGGIAIGLVEVFTAAYQPEYLPALGDRFYLIAPYVVMLLVLMVRPYGLFGTREVERV